MTDELSIQAIEVNKPQQSQKSTTPYVLGGAALGGLGTGAYAYLKGKPVYSSYEDIVKEKEDTFNKTAEKFAGEDKKIDKFTNARKALVDADQKWEAEFKAYVEQNKGGEIIKDDNYRQLEGDLNNRNLELENKKTELINKEIDKIKAENPTNEAGEALSEVEIKEKAKNAIKEADYKTELEAKNAAQKALDEAGAKLPKAEEKSEKALLKAFEESNRTKKAALEEAANGVKDDLKVLMEKRMSNGKMAAIVAAGVVALGALGYLIAPKN